LKTERLPPPSYIALDLTYRCGLDCSFCFVKRHGLRSGSELGLAGWLKLIEGLGPGRKRFYLTGGEPLLAPFLPELVKELKRRGHSTLVTTGLLVPPARAAALAAAGPGEIVVSVHGPAGMHEAAVRAPGAWNKIRRNLEMIKARRPAGTRLTLWCTINRGNHADLPETYRALKALGPDRIAFNHLEFSAAADVSATRRLLAGIGTSTPVKPSAGLAGGIDIKELAAGIAAVKRLSAGTASFYPDLAGAALRNWYAPSRDFKKPGFCRGQFGAAWFSPAGELLTCQPLAIRISGRTGDFSAAYNGAAYSAFRKLLLKNGGFLPACRRCGREPYSSRGKI
jgi:MoaA/NifB/PqqE/SkfB family radical SAM enzyme